MSHLIKRIADSSIDYEDALVQQYTQRLLALSRKHLQTRFNSRIDPEDVVQSVYLSFFRRMQEGQFSFDESHDIWRLLATMTFHKTLNAVRFHQQERRDVRREQPGMSPSEERPEQRVPELTAGPDDVLIFCEYLERLLARLPQSNHEIVALHLQGYSIAEIATRVERSQRTVLRSLARLRTVADDELEPSG